MQRSIFTRALTRLVLLAVKLPLPSDREPAIPEGALIKAIEVLSINVTHCRKAMGKDPVDRIDLFHLLFLMPLKIYEPTVMLVTNIISLLDLLS
jgi:hypothetical protein